jgi:hypothetical protein
MQIMLSEMQQKQVWEGWLSGKIRAHYFADLCGRYQRLQRLVTWAILLVSSGAAAAVLYSVPDSVAVMRPVLALAAAGLSLWSLVANNTRNATDCADLHFRWNILAMAYEDLWTNMYAPKAPEQLNALRQREAEIGKSSTAVPYKEHVMKKWSTWVIRHHTAPATS